MIYVDEARHYPTCKLPTKYWCHMAADGNLKELHAMACQLGLQHIWFHNKAARPHYDITPLQRAQAIQLGARAVSSKDLVRQCWPPRCRCG
ncbi:MAG: DUF4031 domain-containing protein [Ktedonobacteraceae bacterium]|nr:DUF4031 domain-containing protein [Ktedonobacteraceae bacterium]